MSLDDLTTVMGPSRSSFYGTFGSKQAVLLASLRTYVDQVFASLEACVVSEPDPIKAVRAMNTALASHFGDDRGCLLVNSVTELAPENPDMSELARSHIDRVAALMASTLRRARFLTRLLAPAQPR